MAATWRKVLRQTSVLLSPSATRPSLRKIHEPLPKIPDRVSWLLIELITYVDTHCSISETLYRDQGRDADVSELFKLFQHHASTTSAPISERLPAFSSAVLTTVIVQILHTYEPLLSYTVSQELLERGSTVEAIATAKGPFHKPPSAPRPAQSPRTPSRLDVRKPVKHLSRLVGLHVVRPFEDHVYLNQRDVVKARVLLSNALIAGAASWPYDCHASMPTDKELLFLLKLQWPEGAIASEDQLLRCLSKYGAVESIECDLGSRKAKVCLRLRSSKPLHQTVLKLHSKARIYVVCAALQHEADAAPEVISLPTACLKMDTTPGDRAPNATSTNGVPPVEMVDCSSMAVVTSMDAAVNTMPMAHNPVATPVDSVAVQMDDNSVGTTTTSCQCDTVAIGVDESSQTTAETDGGPDGLQLATKYAHMQHQLGRLRGVLAATTATESQERCSEPLVPVLEQLQQETLRLLDAILADAPSEAFETHMEKLHDNHVHAMTKVLEAEVRASQELLRLHKAQYDAQAKHWEVELTTAKLLRLEAEKLNTDLRQELHSTRSELACHLAMLSHLRRCLHLVIGVPRVILK
ncbi:hypothetical protein SPRG_20345 [Saprolegnia parasitica CBS 223.65]|uniref:Rho-GAP domain-containing protein n=1 Tax=Saprolegnia parasitica (strain CBS 223.65) TaxID=695850 RepID=A0A067CAX1_SAPPC|nr:hypothetical protein SPRG_20345 [Saprolegnia parasitica CBS 223.65]KDO27919.1 hypothetical protein SPRG_20345 [Saprolegnia parasitica CBS 223.65]|eukprot:XP_012201461.1 hypothetical protein SPRG_20345 [Saprolegnia parasitica CBS 223.65]